METKEIVVTDEMIEAATFYYHSQSLDDWSERPHALIPALIEVVLRLVRK